MAKAKKEAVEGADWIEQKAQAIRDSKLPESQKHSMLKEIGAIKGEDVEEISFAVYAKTKGIPKDRHAAMKAYPAAKGVKSAPMAKWEEIFKSF